MNCKVGTIKFDDVMMVAVDESIQFEIDLLGECGIVDDTHVLVPYKFIDSYFEGDGGVGW